MSIRIPQGYTFRAAPSPNGTFQKPAWHAQVRRKGWSKGYSVTVSSNYGPIEYTTPAAARCAAIWWASQNEEG